MRHYTSFLNTRNVKGETEHSSSSQTGVWHSGRENAKFAEKTCCAAVRKLVWKRTI